MNATTKEDCHEAAREGRLLVDILVHRARVGHWTWTVDVGPTRPGLIRCGSSGMVGYGSAEQCFGAATSWVNRYAQQGRID